MKQKSEKVKQNLKRKKRKEKDVLKVKKVEKW